MLRLKFVQEKKLFDQTIEQLFTLLDNEYYDTTEYQTMCGNLRANVTMQFTHRLNEEFKTNFVGTEMFFNTFGSLHEIDYDTLVVTVALYNLMVKHHE